MRAFLCVLLMGGLHAFVAAPTMNKGLIPMSLSRFQPTPRVFAAFAKRHPQAAEMNVDAMESLLLAPPSDEPSAPVEGIPIMSNVPDPYPFSFSFASQASESTATVTETEEGTVTITASVTPTIVTVTDTITITQVASSVSVSSPTSVPFPGQTGQVKAIWEASTTLTSLDSFQVSKFASGEKNFKIVTGIPSTASGRPGAVVHPTPSSSTSSFSPSIFSAPHWDNTSTVFQVFYPSGTIDPAQSPVGGADFYAAPLPLGNATSVTLRYSAFIPFDFDWVRGGKMPGLYGGHAGCSGGNAAVDCFSTRLMWRADGAGELYLYAPKDKQTKELCADPQSVCDAAYGLSVGRGAYSWVAGAWTTVEQTVSLNTPGKPDGTFELRVNGERKISRSDVFYRGGLSGSSGTGAGKTTRAPSKTTATRKGGGKTESTEPPTPTSTDDGGPLGPILGPIIGGLGLRAIDTRMSEVLERDATVTGAGLDLFPHPVVRRDLKSQTPESLSGPTPAPVVVDTNSSSTITNSHELTVPSLPQPTAPSLRVSTQDPGQTALDMDTNGASENVDAESVSKASGEEVKFVGIFFSTFFGGHEPEYATPRDQYMWFKDFALSHNS